MKDRQYFAYATSHLLGMPHVHILKSMEQTVMKMNIPLCEYLCCFKTVEERIQLYFLSFFQREYRY